MKNRQGFGRLWGWALARPDVDVALDAADVGTAFGMELSIEAEQREAGETQAVKPAKPAPVVTRPGR